MISVNDFLGEYELLGWIVETRWYPESWENGGYYKEQTNWENHWNHKLYKTEEAARQAMKHHGTPMRKQEYRYRPVFSKKIELPAKPINHE